jgi:hypothetical protein
MGSLTRTTAMTDPGPRPREIDWHRIGRQTTHPLQRWMLEAIGEAGNEAASPTGLQKRLEELGTACPIWPIPRLNTVSNHVNSMKALGYLELRRRVARRGAVEHFYAVSEDYLLSGQAEANRRLRAASAQLARSGPNEAERLARRFHETYEALAPAHGYKTREESAVPWDEVPATNKRLMVAVCEQLLSELEIEADLLRVAGLSA